MKFRKKSGIAQNQEKSGIIRKIRKCLTDCKRPTGLNGHLSIRDFTLTSCQKGSYLNINSPIKELMKINDGIGKQHHTPLIVSRRGPVTLSTSYKVSDRRPVTSTTPYIMLLSRGTFTWYIPYIVLNMRPIIYTTPYILELSIRSVTSSTTYIVLSRKPVTSSTFYRY